MDDVFSLWVFLLMIITLILVVSLFSTTALSLFFGGRTRLDRTGKRWLSSSSSSAPLLPLGTLGWPFIGETVEFISCAYTHSPESFMERRRGLYGKVFKSHLFGSPSYPKSLTELMGKSSILVINGSLQKKIHGLIAVFLKSPHLRTRVINNMQNYVQRSMETWTEHAPVLIQNEAKTVAFQVLVKVLIGLDPGAEMELLKKDFQEFMRGLMSLPVKIPGSQLYRSLQAKKRMVKLVKNIISSRRKNTSRSEEDIPQDVIDVLLFNGDEQLSDNLISDNMIDLMIPGEDSVPILMTLAVKYLSECPSALKHTYSARSCPQSIY